MNVLVTGGGTIAPIDDVRWIANASSGQFSAQITECWLERGATVWHVHAPAAQRPFHRLAWSDLDAKDPATEIARLEALRSRYQYHRGRLHFRPLSVGTVGDYAQMLQKTLRQTPFDVLMLAMAASDFEPIPASGKIASGESSIPLTLHPTAKVIRSVRRWAPEAYLVGFKLLHDTTPDILIAAAQAANAINQADLTVANDLRLKQDHAHTLHLVRPDQPVETLGPRADLARALVDRVAAWSRERVPHDR